MTPQGRDRQRDAGHRADRRRPGPGRVDDDARGDGAARRLDGRHRAALDAKTRDLHVPLDPNTRALGGCREPHRHAIGVTNAVARAERGGFDALSVQPRREDGGFARAQPVDRDTERSLQFHRRAERVNVREL